jgi:hypothetical protein
LRVIKIKRSTVRRAAPEVRPSRIRREPVAAQVQKTVRPYPTEREIWTVAIGVILFAVAIALVTFGVSDVTSH